MNAQVPRKMMSLINNEWLNKNILEKISKKKTNYNMHTTILAHAFPPIDAHADNDDEERSTAEAHAAARRNRHAPARIDVERRGRRVAVLRSRYADQGWTRGVLVPLHLSSVRYVPCPYMAVPYDKRVCARRSRSRLARTRAVHHRPDLGFRVRCSAHG